MATVSGNTEGHNTGRILGGLALLAPMVVLWLVSLVLPTLQTLLLSLQSVLLTGSARWVGLANYQRLFDQSSFPTAMGFTTLLTFERLLAVAVIPPLLALALNAFGRAARLPLRRLPLRLFFTLPLALFAPVAIARTWALAYNPQFGVFGGGGTSLSSPGQARWAVLRMDALVTLGIACGLGLILYLLALRGPNLRGGRIPRPFLIVWVVTLCATAALAVQTFAPIFVLTGGGPANHTSILSIFMYEAAFATGRIGYGAAIATVLALLPALLGTVVGVIIATSGLRLTTASTRMHTGLAAQLNRSRAGLILCVVGLVAAAALIYSLLPLFWAGFASLKSVREVVAQSAAFLPAAPTLAAYERVAQAVPSERVWANTLVPPAMSIFLLQLPIAYLGALGIGALRPLGRWSEWLLLPFAPWLFITALPLGIANFQRIRELRVVNTLFGLIPPSVMAVPLLFILTLAFKGAAENWHAARAADQSAGGSFLKTVIMPSLPLATILSFAAVAITTQDVFWPFLATSSREWQTIPVALLRIAAEGGTTDVPLIAAAIWRFGWPFWLTLFVAIALCQIFYFDRLALVTGPTAPVAVEAADSPNNPVETAA